MTKKNNSHKRAPREDNRENFFFFGDYLSIIITSNLLNINNYCNVKMLNISLNKKTTATTLVKFKIKKINYKI